MAHLLDPGAEGNFQDLGSPRTIRLQGGFESPDHLRSIAKELWTPVAARLPALESEALVALVEVVDDWIRVEKRFEGAFGAKPTEEQSLAASEFLEVLLPAIAAAATGKRRRKWHFGKRPDCFASRFTRRSILSFGS